MWHLGLFAAQSAAVVDSPSELSSSGPRTLYTSSPLILTANNRRWLLLAHFVNKEIGSERPSYLAQGHIIGAGPRIGPRSA